jgi:hypothetical protein
MENFYQTFKQLEEEAPNFWKNTENNLEERIEVFEKYGKHKTYIPSETDLPFNLYCIFRYVSWGYEKYSNITIFEMIDNLFENDYFENRFKSINEFQRIETTKRNYVPSEEAIDRYRNILIKQVLKQDLYSFTFDW